MNASDVPGAVGAAVAAASAAGLRVADADVIHESNRIAVHLRPSDTLARVAYDSDRWVAGAEFEVDVARSLIAAGGPVGALDPRVEPRVHRRDGFAVTLWTYYESQPSEVAAPAYAWALRSLHASMRHVPVTAPRFTVRVAEAQSLLGDRARTPDLSDEDRGLLSSTLETFSASIANAGGAEQLLHGEPHPGNVLHSRMGPLFVDLETCCRGPVEFDIAHAPADVSKHYPGINHAVLRECRILMLAMVTTWRWDRDDRLPSGRRLAAEWIGQMRAALDAGA
jgi:hypothetical protein